MTETSERYRRLSEIFTGHAEAVAPGDWDNPAPCEGWVARDILRHMVDTSAFFLERAGVALPEGPSVDVDPVGAWAVARDAVQSALDDPDVAQREFDGPAGRGTLEQTVGMFGVGDVLVHTWDLCRSVGVDVRLDPDEVARLMAVMEPNDELMRQGGAFGPRVEVPDDADEQDRLIAFTGRQP